MAQQPQTQAYQLPTNCFYQPDLQGQFSGAQWPHAANENETYVLLLRIITHREQYRERKLRRREIRERKRRMRLKEEVASRRSIVKADPI